MKLALPIPSVVKKAFNSVKPIARHHYFFFGLLLLAGLSAATYMVNQTLSMPSDQAYAAQQTQQQLKGDFDKTTIQKIQALTTTTEQSNGQAPEAGARTNPFAE